MPTEDTIATQLTTLLEQNQHIRFPLRRLRMHFISHPEETKLAPRVSPAVAERLAIAISKIRSLKFVHFTTLTAYTIGKTIPHCSLPFNASTCGYLSLPLDCKLAFLSAVHRLDPSRMIKVHGENESSALGLLDERVLSLIIFLSGQAVRCHVLLCHKEQLAGP